MTDSLYNGAKARLVKGEIDWESADLRALLLDDAGAYTFDADDDFVADLTPASNELSATNYARQTLSGLSVNRDDTNDLAQLLASNVVIADLGSGDSPMDTIQALVIYEHNADDEAARLVAYCGSFTATLTGTSTTFAFAGGVVATL